MAHQKLTADQLRRIEEIEEFRRAADHLNRLVTELEGNRAGQTRTIQQLSEKIANEASQMRQRALTANVGTIADVAGTMSVMAGRGGGRLGLLGGGNPHRVPARHHRPLRPRPPGRRAGGEPHEGA